MGTKRDLQKYNINSDFILSGILEETILARGFEWNANMEFKNFWNIFTGGSFQELYS